jgi:hypothetical protein
MQVSSALISRPSDPPRVTRNTLEDQNQDRISFHHTSVTVLLGSNGICCQLQFPTLLLPNSPWRRTMEARSRLAWTCHLRQTARAR